MIHAGRAAKPTSRGYKCLLKEELVVVLRGQNANRRERIDENISESVALRLNQWPSAELLRSRGHPQT